MEENNMAKFNFFSKLFGSKQEYDVELTEAGPNMVMVIKVVREVTGLGLKEAKEIVDTAPSIVKRKCQEGDAQNIKAKLETEGAKVTLK